MQNKNMICFKCSKAFLSVDTLIQHIRHLHPFSHSFVCKQENCYRTFPLINGFKKHLIKNHIENKFLQLDTEKQMQILVTNVCNVSNDKNVTSDIGVDTSLDTSDTPNVSKSSDNETLDILQIFQNAIVCFMAKMYSDSSLPRNIIQYIIEDIKELFQVTFVYVKSTLKKQNLAEDILNKVSTIFTDIENIFEKLGTEHRRLKFLENNKCYIKPSTFCIGERPVLAKTNKSYEANMTIEKCEGQIIPLRDILKQFLQLPNVFHDIISYMQEEESLYDNNIRTSILQDNL